LAENNPADRFADSSYARNGMFDFADDRVRGF
jgi:hypothetical protein